MGVVADLIFAGGVEPLIFILYTCVYTTVVCGDGGLGPVMVAVLLPHFVLIFPQLIAGS